MIEAGSQVATSALKSGLVNQIVWYRAPVILGGDAMPVISDLGLDDLDQAFRYIQTDQRSLGVDSVEIYEQIPG